MNLNLSQLQAFKGIMAAETDVTFAADRTARHTAAMADFYNVSSTFVVWKTRVSQQDLLNVMVWTEMLTMTQAKFNTLTLLLQPGFFDASSSNVQTGIVQIFSGLASTLAAVTLLAKRYATRGEALVVTGTGTVATPGYLTLEGSITNENVIASLAS